MDVPKNGPTLEGVIQRLEVLERENAKLRGKVATLEGSATRKEQLDGIEGPDAVAEERVSRKAMLAKAGAAAVAVAAAGTMLSPREARAATVEGSGNPGVLGIGLVTGGVGVKGETDVPGTGVSGEGRGAEYAGVKGTNDTGTGVRGQSSENGYSGVFGLHQGSSGDGVSGVSLGDRAGVVGQCAAGAGVEGLGSRYGGKFAGSRAQLLLVPKGTTGRPRSGTHQKGEIYLDSAGTVFVCTKSGTPGTWRKVTTTSA